MKQPPFLPMTEGEMRALGWDAVDVLLVSGDAYVDHPAFGIALLGRYLIDRGFRVGVVAQPRWQNAGEAGADLGRLGRPRLLAGVSAGAVDSMLARYTAFRKMRSDDAYTPGGMGGARPNRAVLVYAGLIRRIFPGLPLVIGGIEASLRRASHYDFWSDALRRSILLDSKADLLVCGMGESALLAATLAAEEALRRTGNTGENASLCRAFQTLVRGVPGAAVAISAKEAALPHAVHLPSHEAVLADKSLLVTATLALEQQVHQGLHPAVQISGERAVLINAPAPPLSAEELDALHALPFSRLPHPSYTQPIPAWEMIRTSITSHRGCAGGCAFCSLALHQSRRIASRGRESILAEARLIARGPGEWGFAPLPTRGLSPLDPASGLHFSATRKNEAPEWGPRGVPLGGVQGQRPCTRKPPAWAGSISDVGGPSANMWGARCGADPARCLRQSCLHPALCPDFVADQAANAELLREMARQEGVRHVRVASGLRFDLALADADALAAYTREFTGGQLKIAPEHVNETVLRLMRKPKLAVFERFLAEFTRQSEAAGKEQYVIPYLMSAYPGCTDEAMRELAAWLKRRGWRPQQVQCFIPTPGTVATAMFYAGRDTKGAAIPVARTDAERMRQHYMLVEKQSRPDKGKKIVRKTGFGSGREKRR